MLTPKERLDVSLRAYVPEHAVGLMRGLTGLRVDFVRDNLCLVGEDRVLLVGHPLGRDYSSHGAAQAVTEALGRFKPRILDYIGARLPEVAGLKLLGQGGYQVLDLAGDPPAIALADARRAGRFFESCRVLGLGAEHEALLGQTLAGVEGCPGLAEPALRSLAGSDWGRQAVVLEVRGGAGSGETGGRLEAFCCVDLEPARLAVCTVGLAVRAGTKSASTGLALDVLMGELLRLAGAEGKKLVFLGLGGGLGGGLWDAAFPGPGQDLARLAQRWGARTDLPWISGRWTRPDRGLGALCRRLKLSKAPPSLGGPARDRG